MDAQGIFKKICMETQFVIRKIVEGLYLFFENSDNDTFAEKKATLPLHNKKQYYDSNTGSWESHTNLLDIAYKNMQKNQLCILHRTILVIFSSFR
jgi:hypothetical protein